MLEMHDVLLRLRKMEGRKKRRRKVKEARGKRGREKKRKREIERTGGET